MALATPEIKLRWAGTYKITITLKALGLELENNYKLKVK
jgi:hypothetical protein